MRIIAGKLRRRKLLTNKGLVTRPITDRIKEILFSRLGDFDDLRVADVFAGTGTIGLEAISRGASSAVFMEKDRRALELLRENISRLGVEDQTVCWSVDVTRTSFCPKGVDSFLPYDIVFFDPPYVMAKDLMPGRKLYKSVERLGRDRATSATARLVVRTEKDERIELPAEWEIDEEVSRSSMTIRIFRKVEETDSSDLESDGHECPPESDHPAEE